MKPTVHVTNGRLHQGRWLKKDAFIARVVDRNGARLRGLVSEDDVARIGSGAKGRFIPDDPALAAIEVSLSEVAIAGESEFQNDYLASVYGGRVAAERDADGKLKPVSGVHLVRFATQSDVPERVRRGVIHVEGEAQSVVAGIWRQVVRVIVREASL